MVKQYPHIVTIKGNSQNALFQNGKWEIPQPGPDTEQACRYEPSKLNREVEITDGVTLKYTGILYLPLSSPDIEAGVLVEIKGVITAKALFFYRGQLNCTCYL